MALSWSKKRQIVWGALVGGVCIFFLAFILAPFFRTTPTCIDGAQNGTEEGIDCGGSCARFCAFQVDTIVVRWSRMFEVVPGMYTAVAEIRNRNATAGVRTVPYEFSFYDEDNLFITRTSGTAFIEPNTTSYIMDTNINVGNRVPVRTTFRFTESPVFERQTFPVSSLSIEVSGKRYSETPNGGRLRATLKNLSLEAINEPIEVVALLVDREGNVIAGSKTIVPILAGSAIQDVYFSWPSVFTTPVAETLIYPRINPFTSLE